jgi:hypothetical protein
MKETMAQDKEQKRDAIIFVPGLGRELVDQRIDTVARKLAGALDRQAERPEPKFQVIGAPEEEYGQTYRTPVRTISVQEPGSDEAQPLADLYELDYRDNLTKRFNERNPLCKAFVMLRVMFAMSPTFIMSLRRKGKSLKDKLQMLTIGGIMAAIVAYTVMLIGAGALTLNQAAPEIKKNVSKYIKQLYVKQEPSKRGETQGKGSPNKESDKGNSEDGLPALSNTGDGNAGVSGDDGKNDKDGSGTNGDIGQDNPNNNTNEKNKENVERGANLNPIQTLVLVLVALGLFKKKSFKDVTRTIATEYVCASNYLRMAYRKPAVLGQAAALLEHIAEKKEAYRQVHMVAYSFGSLVALDILFPHLRPWVRLGTVKSLVTIGCPFDLVRTYWPEYFERRNRQPGVPTQWINIYAPLDVFGSNFRDDTEVAAAEHGITVGGENAETVVPTSNIAYDLGLQTSQLKLLDIFTTKGIRIHSFYWTGDDAPEVSCLDHVAAELYRDDPLLIGTK